MDLHHDHLINGILNSIKKDENTIKSLERELKHNLILTVQETPAFPEDSLIEVNFHFNGFRKSKIKQNHWEYRFYMYARERGIEFLRRHESYPELLKGLYDRILELARMDQVLRSINN